MSHLFGTFREETGLGIGDAFKDRPAAPMSRYQGKQFGVQFPKEGNVPESWMDKKVCSLREGDRYVDMWILEQRWMKGQGKRIGAKPFFPVGGTKKSSCAGAKDVCLGDVPLDTDASAAANAGRPITAPVDSKHKIYASPAKKGGCGYSYKDRSLGGQAFGYLPDGYEGGRELERQARKKALGQIKQGAFRTCGQPPRAFTPDPELYARATPPPEGASSSGRGSPDRTGGSRSGSRSGATWRPSSPSKSGAPYAAISNVGRTWMPDPVLEAKFHAKTRATTASFKPVGSCHKRLSMWTPNPYYVEARPAPDIDFML